MIAKQNTWGINIISDKLWQLQRKEMVDNSIQSA